MLNLYYPKGTLIFWYDTWKIRINREDFNPSIERSELVCGKLMSGHDFFEDVDNNSITDYDGMLGNVYVDGYKSNLGLCHGNFCQGGFLVDGETWLSICDDHKVEVEWCNK